MVNIEVRFDASARFDAEMDFSGGVDDDIMEI
jgi:hypothetical protein